VRRLKLNGRAFKVKCAAKWTSQEEERRPVVFVVPTFPFSKKAIILFSLYLTVTPYAVPFYSPAFDNNKDYKSATIASHLFIDFFYNS